MSIQPFDRLFSNRDLHSDWRKRSAARFCQDTYSGRWAGQTTNGTLDQASLFNRTLVTGANNVLTLTGNTGGDAALSGNLSFVASAVPEPATWAMMIGGFGMIGFAVRRRATTKVVFA